MLAWCGLGWLAQRYRVLFDRACFERDGYLAGSDDRRRAELERALFHPDVRAVIAVRGGYGASRFVHAIDWERFARAPRWVVGFSDITAIHVEIARAGVASIHGAHVANLGRGDHRARTELTKAIEEPGRGRSFARLETMRPGIAEGILFGGNITMLHACAAAGRLAIPDGAILLLEDVTERPYRIDRMLTTLRVGGYFDRIAGIVLGDFTECEPGPDGVDVARVARECLLPLGVPIAAGLPFGHELPNAPIVMGARARLEASAGNARLEIESVSDGMAD